MPGWSFTPKSLVLSDLRFKKKVPGGEAGGGKLAVGGFPQPGLTALVRNVDATGLHLSDTPSLGHLGWGWSCCPPDGVYELQVAPVGLPGSQRATTEELLRG